VIVPTIYSVKNIRPGEYLEKLLVGEWGLSRKVLKRFRDKHLVNPEHWRSEREVILTPAGLTKMRQHFKIEETTVVPLVMTGSVTRWDWRNSKMVEVEGDDGRTYRVRVQNALKWRPDRQGKFMRIKFQRDGDQYRQMGRSPRYPGIW
jgi:hypothetical protein